VSLCLGGHFSGLSGLGVKGSFTYSISSDGSLTITAGSDTLNGIVSADGTIYTLVKTTGDEIGILVGIKESPLGMPSATLLLLGD
jgi:hypothetical protein